MKAKLQLADYAKAAAILGCTVPAIRAVARVESLGGGFNDDGTPITLFEGHKFHEYTAGKFDNKAPTLSFKKWTRKHYGQTWQAEQARLQNAMELDRPAALSAASWGMFQILGRNYAIAGFDNLQTFINAMYRDEPSQLMAFAAFVVNTGLAPALRRHDWQTFARIYNGKRYAENNYDKRMATAFEFFTNSTLA